MAVEATNLSFYPSQLITNGYYKQTFQFSFSVNYLFIYIIFWFCSLFFRDFTNSNQQQNVYMYNTQMGTGPMFTGTVPDNLLPLNQSPVCDSIPAKVCMKADSGVTYNLSASRKHLRDSMMTNFVTPQKNNLNEFSSFLGDEISHHIQQQQQLEIDNIIAHHVNFFPSIFYSSNFTFRKLMLVFARMPIRFCGCVKCFNNHMRISKTHAKLNILFYVTLKIYCWLVMFMWTVIDCIKCLVSHLHNRTAHSDHTFYAIVEFN